MAKILDGQKLANEIKGDLYKKINSLDKRPGLAAVLVGNDPASELYINLKQKACEEVGITFHSYLCNEKCYDEINEKKLIELIEFLNKDEAINGILIQLPLPKEFDTQKIIETMDPNKDADGFHPKREKEKIIPPTIASVIELLKSTGEDLKDKKVLVLGKSDVFTEGMEDYLQKQLEIKSIKHEKEIPENSQDYDVIVIALGQAGILKKEHIKKDAIVIDVGINKVDGETVGDADKSVAEVAGYLSPVPGGVGPLTVACLLRNTYLLSI